MTENTSTFKLITGTRSLTIEYSVHSLMAGLLMKMLLFLFSIYNVV